MHRSATLLLPALLPLIMAGCCGASDLIERSRREILATEKAFEAHVRDHGVPDGFAHFADDSAVIDRGNTLVRGPAAIRAWYAANTTDRMTITWDAEFVDVAASGDLGHTWGRYVHTTIDSAGTPRTRTGIFHTVWKRQPDGTWKYVWD